MQILARIPQDVGTVIRCSTEDTVLVVADKCHGCKFHDAAVIIRGDSDYVGFTPVWLCPECVESVLSEEQAYLKALDVEDRTPAPGHIFIVEEQTVKAGYGTHLRHFRSYRNATGFFRRASQYAVPYGGLTPNAGVREVRTTPVADMAMLFPDTPEVGLRLFG